MDFGEILYGHNVVGAVSTYAPIVITGGRTSLFLTSQRMPSRYGCVHKHLQLYKRNNYIYVNVIIYVYMNTSAVVCCHNNESAVFFSSILYGVSFVGNDTYFTYTKMGATLPVLKNEIRDFFFARLGTGRTSQGRRATDANTYTYNNKKRTGNDRFPNIHRDLR